MHKLMHNKLPSTFTDYFVKTSNISIRPEIFLIFFFKNYQSLVAVFDEVATNLNDPVVFSLSSQ